jgi:hypothetical protein
MQDHFEDCLSPSSTAAPGQQGQALAVLGSGRWQIHWRDAITKRNRSASGAALPVGPPQAPAWQPAGEVQITRQSSETLPLMRSPGGAPPLRARTASVKDQGLRARP